MKSKQKVATFNAKVYKSARQFSIPKATRDELGITSGDSVHLVVRDARGAELFTGRKTLMSGPEIYGRDIAPKLIPGAMIEVEASMPISFAWLPSESAAAELIEVGRVAILVNRFERNPKARAECLKIYGIACCVCGFDFEQRYGVLGRGFIHVHHLTPVSQIGRSYKIDPKNDLRPVCPNCHEMLHSGPNQPLSIEALRLLIRA